jgi:hypothetical protein
MLADVITSLDRDWRFMEAARNGLAPQTLQALDEFWRKPEFSSLKTALGVPHPSWQDTVEFLSTLVRNGSRGNPEVLYRLAHAVRDSPIADPLAAAIAALYPLAAWESLLGNQLYFERWPGGPRGLDAGWLTFPLVAARRLLDADAIWTARRLTRAAVEGIENSERWNMGRDPGVTAQYRSLLREADGRHAECIANLAWDLRESCRPEGPNFRPEVAAMFWTLGDVPHAHLLHTTSQLPSQSSITSLVQRSMQVMHLDPALQGIWIQLKDRPPFPLRSHRELFESINKVWSDSRQHELTRGETVGQHMADLMRLFGEAPSDVYADAVTRYFRDDLTDELSERLLRTHHDSEDTLAQYSPEALLRFRCLITLIVDPARIGAWSQAERWADIARDSCRLAELREQSLRDAYDRTLDIPFYYLPRDDPDDVSRAAELTERYRAAAQWFWRRAIAVPGDPGVEAADRDREKDLRQRLRRNLLLRSLPYLPVNYVRLTSEEVSGQPGVLNKELGDLVRQASAQARELATEFDGAFPRPAPESAITLFAKSLVPGPAGPG